MHFHPPPFTPTPSNDITPQGVSLPGLGSFAVGQCVDTMSGASATKRAPVFMLHEKFANINQNKGRYFLKVRGGGCYKLNAVGGGAFGKPRGRRAARER